MLRLSLNGKRFEGWTAASITRSIEQVAATFLLEVTNKWQDVKWDIRPGDSCEITFDKTRLITGFIDSVSIKTNKTAHTVTISGRSKTGDLVDCSCRSRQYRNQTLNQIANDMASVVGITATGGNDELFATYKPDDGAHIFESLDRIARLKGLLLTDNEKGELVIGQSPIKGPALEMGKNILTSNVSFDARDRYSTYEVKGQSKGSDLVAAKDYSHATYTEKDTQIKRTRPLIIIAEDQANLADVKRRAIWEKNTRWSRSQAFTYAVQGWISNNQMWKPNMLCSVKDDLSGINQELLIVSVNYSLDDSGTIAELNLAPKEGYLPAPIVINKTTKKTSTKPTVDWDLF